MTAFGINAYTAANAGDEIVEEHSEQQLGHEEIYAVMSRVMRPSRSTARRSMRRRARSSTSTRGCRRCGHAVATEPGTTVLAIGGVPGKHEVSAWEYFFPALAPMRGTAGTTTRRACFLEEGLAEKELRLCCTTNWPASRRSPATANARSTSCLMASQLLRPERTGLHPRRSRFAPDVRRPREEESCDRVDQAMTMPRVSRPPKESG